MRSRFAILSVLLMAMAGRPGDGSSAEWRSGPVTQQCAKHFFEQIAGAVFFGRRAQATPGKDAGRI